MPVKPTVAGEPAALLASEIEPFAVPTAVGENDALKDALAPAATVIGKLPLTLKPFPEGVAEVIVRDALPEFVNDTVCVPFPPTFTLPKFTFGVPSVNCAWPAVAVPFSAIVSGEFGALLVIETLPFAAPATVGENLTPKEAFCPAAKVRGVESPVVLNAEPETLAEMIVTPAEPAFESVTFTVLLLPVSWLPKLTDEGFAVRLPSVPLPVIGIVMFASLAVLTTAMLPDAVPDVVGANCAVKLADCPAAMVSGAVKPITLNPVPVAVAWFTVTLALPEFCKVIVCVPLLETATLPKFTLPGFAVSVEVADTALPINVTTCGEPGALSVNVMLPVAAPAVVGANCTLNEIDWPPEIVFGSESPDIPNWLPLSVARLIVTFELPVLESVTDCELD